MKDKEIYTEEGIKAIIKHIRLMRQILMDEESRYLLLYQAARDLGSPVDAMGRVWAEKRRRFKPSPELSPYLLQALKTGETQTLPGWQD